MIYVVMHVPADDDPTPAGNKRPRKAAVAGRAQIDLEKVAKEQQIKNQEEMEKILAAVKAKYDEGQVRGESRSTDGGREAEINAITGLGKSAGAGEDKVDASKATVLSEHTGSKGSKGSKGSRGSKGKAKKKNPRRDGKASKSNVPGCVTKTGGMGDAPENEKSDGVDFDKVTGKVDLCPTMHFLHQHFSE